MAIFHQLREATDPQWEDPDVQFVTVPGTHERESALVVRRPNGTTLVLNDVIGNMAGESGFGGWFLRKMGFAGDERHIPRPVKLPAGMPMVRTPTFPPR